MKFSTQSSVVPFDIITLIIDIVGENKDMDFLKELALVSHSFHRICDKHLFATVELYDVAPGRQRTFSKKGFVKLLQSRPYIVKYIRNLRYVASDNGLGSLRENPSILPNFLKTIPQLNCLGISGISLDWNRLDPSLISALLHLMHLPAINRINLSFINNFPLSSLAPCVNLHELNLLHMDGFPEIIQSEMPRIRQLYIPASSKLTSMMLCAKRRDGRPAFDFTDLRQLWMSFTQNEDEANVRHLLQTAKLDKLHLFVKHNRLTLVGLHDILSPGAHTLKVLELSVPLCHNGEPPLAGLCDELEAMAGHNVLETLDLQVDIDDDVTVDSIGSRIETVVKVLVKPGWSALKQVSVDISILCCLASRETSAEVIKALQSLPQSPFKTRVRCSAHVAKCQYCNI